MRDDGIHGGLLAGALWLLEIEPSMFPLLPKWLYNCLTCSKSSDNDEKSDNNEETRNFDDFRRKFEHIPAKTFRTFIEDSAQAIIQLCFCIMVSSSTTSWLGAVLSLVFFMKNFGPYFWFFVKCCCVNPCKKPKIDEDPGESDREESDR